MAARPLPGTEMHVYLQERLRDRRLMRLVNILVWLTVALCVLLLWVHEAQRDGGSIKGSPALRTPMREPLQPALCPIMSVNLKGRRTSHVDVATVG